MNTPETDAALYPMHGVDIVWPEFARKLERERDEARKESEYYKERYEQIKEIPKWYNGREIPAQIKEETK